jgi:hypothetical protein
MPAVWRVDEPERAAFAVASGDLNPIHTDPVASRAFPFGRVAVHGMQILLDTLERVVVATDGAPRRVRCTFRHSVAIGQPMATEIDVSGGGTVRARVGVDVWPAAEITVDLGEQLTPADYPIPVPPPEVPEEHDIDSLRGRSGVLEVAAGDAIAEAHPHLAAAIGRTTLAELTSLTRLVGMHAPGLYSLDSSLDIALGGGSARPGTLAYSVSKVDDRFAQVTLAVDAATLSGRVVAFVRPRPVIQRLGATLPDPGEFSGQRWLVIGGSRGLGAASVLLLAAGGADVRFTYRCCATDASAIGARAGHAVAHELDAEHPGAGLSAVTSDGWRPTHLAYMATPPMHDGMRGAYSPALYERFRSIYSDAFGSIVEALAGGLSGVLFPSSALLDGEAPAMAEFVAAKRDGERTAATLAGTYPHLRIACPRLPRLLTDQTTSYVPVEYADTGAEVLRALRDVTGRQPDHG